MHENVRLCVECNRHSWSCPVKRLRSSGAERARAAISGAPAGPSGLERECRAPQRSRAGSKLETSTGAMFSSSQAEQFRAPWRSRASSNGHFERPSRAERARAAISSAPAEPSGLDVGNVGRCGVFEQARPSRAGSMSETSAGAVISSTPGRAEQARCRKRRQVRCFRAGQVEPSGLDVGNVGRCGVFEQARPSRAGSMSGTSAGAVFARPGRAELSLGACKPSQGPCGDLILDIYLNLGYIFCCFSFPFLMNSAL